MSRLLLLLNLSLSVLFLCSQPARAEKIVGIGLSQSSAGAEFNLSIASANARQFVVEQVTQSIFEFKKKNNHYEISKKLKGTIANIKNKEVIYLRNNGVAVIVQADATLPSFPDERCTKTKYKIRSARDSSKVIPLMVKNAVIQLAKTTFRNKEMFSGVSYIKGLHIKKWRTKSRYTIYASICVARIK